MMTLNFTNGWQKRRFRQVSIAVILAMVYLMSYAQNDQAEQQTGTLSLELLEMLGQFESQDESWLENEISQPMDNIPNNFRPSNSEQNTRSKKSYE